MLMRKVALYGDEARKVEMAAKHASEVPSPPEVSTVHELVSDHFLTSDRIPLAKERPTRLSI
jgi:hypothetical protein